MDDAAYVNQRDRESSYRGEGGANVLAQIQRGQWEWGGGGGHGSSLLMSSAILLQVRVTAPRSRVDRSVHCSTREIAGFKQRKEAPAAAAAAAPHQTPQD